MKSILLLLLVLTILAPFSYYLHCKTVGPCCWMNYDSEIKELATPLQETLANFYKKNNRMASFQEEKKLLESIGCSDIKEMYIDEGDVITLTCVFLKKRFKVEVSSSSFSDELDVYIDYGESHCSYYNLLPNGILKEISCREPLFPPCITIRG